MKNYLFGLLIVGLVLQTAAFADTTNTDTSTQTKVETATSTGTATSTDTVTSTDTATSTESSTETSTDTSKDKEETKASLVPDNAAMNLDFSDNQNVMPANFRGGDPDSELVNCLEDVYYKKQEHSLIYSEDANDVASGSSFAGDPNITWTTQKKNPDGSFETIESENTNMAAKGGTMYSPGEYSIGNSGARQVNEPPKTVASLTEDVTSTETSTDTSTDTDKDTKTVTANQTMGVLVHDCTAPDVWIAFQEGAGSVDMASTELELKQAIYTKVLETAGRPFSDNTSDFEDASYLFIDEGDKDNRNKEPWNKTATVTMAGALFNENGAVTVTTDIVKSGLIDKEEQTRQVHVAVTDDNKISPIYIRRNVPFIFAAVSVDNTDERKAPTDVVARIEKGDGSVVEKIDNAYFFRVPNYPRANYEDQPDYFFVAKAVDEAKNVTTVRIPVYVTDSSASFESSGK